MTQQILFNSTHVMRQYYIHDGEVKKGPFDLDHLREQLIRKETAVWHEGLEDWTRAENVQELQSLLNAATPPPLPKIVVNNLPKRHELLNSFSEAQEILPEKSKSSWLLIVLISLIIISGIVLAILRYR